MKTMRANKYRVLAMPARFGAFCIRVSSPLPKGTMIMPILQLSKLRP